MTNLQKKYKYINFPLGFIAGIDKKRAEMIFSWSILNMAKTIRPDNDEVVAREMAYIFLRNDKRMSQDLWEQFDEDIRETSHFCPDDFMAFESDGTFTGGAVYDFVLSELQKNEAFKSDCVELFQHEKAMDVLGITGPTLDSRKKMYGKLNKIHREGDAIVSINKNLLFDYRDGKLPEDMFRLICAVKSVIGMRNFNKTYKSVLLSRMFGAKNQEILDKVLQDEETRGKYEFLMRRRQFDSLLNRAVDRGLFTIIPASRGYFVSTRYDEEKLQEQIKKRSTMKRSKTKFIKSEAWSQQEA